MSFLEAVREAAKPTHARCGVANWLTTNPGVTDAELRLAINTYGASATHREMVKLGFPRRIDAVARHGRGDCSCPTS